jgi:hypothetical protein
MGAWRNVPSRSEGRGEATVQTGNRAVAVKRELCLRDATGRCHGARTDIVLPENIAVFSPDSMSV